MERLLTVEDVAAELKVTKRYARNLMAKMPHIILGGRKTIRVRETDLVAELRSRTRTHTPEQTHRMQHRRQLVRDGLLTADGRIAQKKTSTAGAN